MEGRLLAKYLGEDNMAKAWKCRVSTYTCPRCAAVDRSRYRTIFFDQKRMCLTSSTKDRKKGCAYDPGVLKIQGALQNQTIRYIDTHDSRSAVSCFRPSYRIAGNFADWPFLDFRG